MGMSTVCNAIFLIFAILGAVDCLMDNRMGLGIQFEGGLGCTGKLIIAMAGFMALAPVLGDLLAPLAGPIFQAVGADPAALAGLLLANDSGGAALAAELAIDPAAGDFHGYFVASMMGGAVMCMIPMIMLNTNRSSRRPALYGLIIGLFSTPFGCALGGVAAGYPLRMILLNLLPTTLLSVALFVALIFLGDLVIGPFQMFGKFLAAVSLFGLLLLTAQELLGLQLVPGITPFSEIIPVIGNIALVLSGVFPLMAVVSRLLQGPLWEAGQRLKIQDEDVAGLLTSAVNIFPTFTKLNEMTPKGVLLNAAFMVGANCMLGDHFAFTSQMRPALVFPVLLAKATSGFLALAVANFLAPTLLKNMKGQQEAAPEI